MNKTIFITASILGALSILIGAFAAHGLKELISIESQSTFETGVRYQMYHAILLLFIGHTNCITPRFKKIIFFLIVFGILCFSGSIYGLATNDLTIFNFKTIGFITPLGGFLFITAWILLIVNFVKNK